MQDGQRKQEGKKGGMVRETIQDKAKGCERKSKDERKGDTKNEEVR